MIFDLPNRLEFGGRSWKINADFRVVLRILTAFDDPELTPQEKVLICLHNLYEDLQAIPTDQLQAAYDAALAFIDRGCQAKQGGPRTMDWEQDAPILFPAINRVAGFETRGAAFLHWWTFMGYFMEIRDSTASTVLALRQKKARGEKLEKWEREFWQKNAAICRLRPKLTEVERVEQERLKAILG